ncbi:addiction module protein [Flavobacterium limnophilum]|uniref:addiction module protein n=1 Tax=Flavobacterium limnophilum TaxID=3003262 RepID=UPI0022AC3C2E|nr:addiction module protein [Flavobacterium limnophilum]
MNAIRQFIEVKNNSFQVVLPEGFTASRVEVIILPSEIEDDIPQWQKDIVLERVAAIKQNPELLIDEEQFWKDIEDAS